MSNRRVKAARDLIAQFVETVGADAVVVCWSDTRNHRTYTYHACIGNAYACQGLAGRLFEALTEDEEEGGETQDETESDGGKSAP